MGRAALAIMVPVISITSVYEAARAQDTDLKNIDWRKLRCDQATFERVSDAWEARHKEVLENLEQAGDDRPFWVGRYYCGDGLGDNESLLLSPACGYTFRLRGCTGIYDQNYGEIKVADDGTLVLSQELASMTPWDDALTKPIHVVRWGDRTYLIRSDEFTDFCNAINSGREPRNGPHGRFFLKDKDWELPATGRPALPAVYAAHLLNGPMCGEIIEVGEEETETVTRGAMKAAIEQQVVPLTINVGSADGVVEGMEFYMFAPPEDALCRALRISVRQVRDTESDAVLVRIMPDRRLLCEPETGWRVSTQAPWRLNNQADPCARDSELADTPGND